MNGINANTGKALSGIAHLRQSIFKILSTPIGTRVARREYGSKLPRLVDAPTNPSTILEIYAATAEALARWEPRFQLTKVKIVSAAVGALKLDLFGNYLPDGQAITLEGVEVV